ncbi:MAG: Rne/Rng family ribonuclease, partial [Acidobacteria bacterium]|nr:Rne/Rng family ribonuclease [Acidobacteriota bacterium]
EIAEPLAEAGASAVDEGTDFRDGKAESKGRGRGRRGREPKQEAKVAVEFDEFPNAVEPTFEPYADPGFERIIDDEETGELFKDAFRQEAIVDQVRAVEFDMEATAEAEVGSLLEQVADTGGFERIADDEETPKPTKTRGARGRGKKAVSTDKISDTASPRDEAPKTRRRAKAEPTGAKTPRSRTKKKAAETVEADNAAENLPDAEASLRETADIADMAVRRGGRGRRRGGRGRREESSNSPTDTADINDLDQIDGESDVVEFADSGKDGASDQSTAAVAEAVIDTPRPPRERREKRADNRTDRTDNRSRTSENGNGRRGERPERSDKSREGERRNRPPQPTISDLLREGQEILVQIAKEPIARKGARITSHIALPGRFLVYMPTIEHLGVSRKIESANERGRLRTLIQRIRSEEEIPSGGFIVRTAGIGISEEDLRQDARYLVRTWLDIKKDSEKAKSPAVVHQDLDIVQRLLRDQLSDSFNAIRVDSEEEYLRIVEFINRIYPRMVNRVKLYTREEPILETYAVQEEIDKALKPRVWLKSGGYLVINQTEALVAIDVNTGKFVGKGNARLEDTITKTNMEAVDEIARQIRLRDLGGIIVLDLIDMEDRRNRHKVSQALQEALSY